MRVNPLQSSAEVTRKTHIHWVGVLTDAAHVLVGALATCVHLLGVDAVLRVQVLNLTVGEDTVEAAVSLEAGAKLRQQRKALFLAREL